MQDPSAVLTGVAGTVCQRVQENESVSREMKLRITALVQIDRLTDISVMERITDQADGRMLQTRPTRHL